MQLRWALNEAAARNDGFLTLDEIGQQAKDARNLEAIAYDLFNETGKIQGKKKGVIERLTAGKWPHFQQGKRI